MIAIRIFGQLMQRSSMPYGTSQCIVHTGGSGVAGGCIELDPDCLKLIEPSLGPLTWLQQSRMNNHWLAKETGGRARDLIDITEASVLHSVLHSVNILSTYIAPCGDRPLAVCWDRQITCEGRCQDGLTHVATTLPRTWFCSCQISSYSLRESIQQYLIGQTQWFCLMELTNISRCDMTRISYGFEKSTLVLFFA
jgi:hypothetical protein